MCGMDALIRFAFEVSALFFCTSSPCHKAIMCTSYAPCPLHAPRRAQALFLLRRGVRGGCSFRGGHRSRSQVRLVVTHTHDPQICSSHVSLSDRKLRRQWQSLPRSLLMWSAIYTLHEGPAMPYRQGPEIIKFSIKFVIETGPIRLWPGWARQSSYSSIVTTT